MTEEERVQEAGAIIMVLLSTLPPLPDDYKMDWPKTARLARQLLKLAKDKDSNE